MLSQAQISAVREMLAGSRSPLFIHDDDADGLCSYLLLYHINNEGKNFIPKGTRVLDRSYVEIVKRYKPDLICILDLPEVEQEFIDAMECRVIWMDHHEPKKRNKVVYINPRLVDSDAYYPTSAMAYEISAMREYMWVAVAGCLADFYLPSFMADFYNMYPSFLSNKWQVKKDRADQPTDEENQLRASQPIKTVSLQQDKHSVAQSSFLLWPEASPDPVSSYPASSDSGLSLSSPRASTMHQSVLAPGVLPGMLMQLPNNLKLPASKSTYDHLKKILYGTVTGELVKFFFFILKGPNSEVREALRVLSKVKDPRDIFEERTTQGRFLHKRFVNINSNYNQILREVLRDVGRGVLLYYFYDDQKWSFTANLANELTVKYPRKVIVIARRRGDEIKASIRAQYRIEPAVKRAMVGVEGRAGGHAQACGAVIKENSWDLFLQQLRQEIKAEKAN